MAGDTDPSRATLRDVYELMGETRKEVNDRIDSLGGKFDTFVTSNEHRLTIVEQHQAAHAERFTGILERLDDHGRDIGQLKDRQRADEAAAQAVTDVKSSRWSTRERVITLIASVVLAAMAIVAGLHF